MTEVRFDLRDFSGVAWPVGTVPVVTFSPSSQAVDPWGVYAGRVSVPGDAGSVELVPTVAMHGDVYYTVELSWVGGGVSRREFWPTKVRVPESGPVELFEIVDVPASSLYQHVEVSQGTTDLGGEIVPHFAETKIWLKLGTNAGIYVRVD